MKRPSRHRSSPMELAPRLNPQAQQHCDAFSKHGLCGVASAQRASNSYAYPDADPPCELQTRRRPTQLTPREAMPSVSPKGRRGFSFLSHRHQAPPDLEASWLEADLEALVGCSCCSLSARSILLSPPRSSGDAVDVRCISRRVPAPKN